MKWARVYFWWLQREKGGERGKAGGGKEASSWKLAGCWVPLLSAPGFSGRVSFPLKPKAPSRIKLLRSLLSGLKTQVGCLLQPPLAPPSGLTQSHPGREDKRTNQPRSSSKQVIFLSLILVISFFFRIVISCILYGEERKNTLPGIPRDWSRKDVHRKYTE